MEDEASKKLDLIILLSIAYNRGIPSLKPAAKSAYLLWPRVLFPFSSFDTSVS
jgi:hypothetical protein